MKKIFLYYFFSFIFLCLGCSVPRNDASSALGRQAISDAVNIALSEEDCTTAITLIEDLYSSENSDNYIRLLRASAQGCKAGLGNFFQFTGKLVNTTENPLAAVPSEGAYFWRTMAKLFYLEKTSSGATIVDSTGLDSRLDGALKATDALLASLKVPKTAVEFANQINTSGNNFGSIKASDRTADSNLYLMYISMAAIGILEDRYGYVSTTPPDKSTFKKGQKLGATGTNPTGWETAVNVDNNGCTYVASILNLKDAVGNVSENLPSGGLKTALSTVSSILNSFDAICTAACIVCGYTCDGCPIQLRNRNSCATDASSTNDEIARCAAAKIVETIDTSTVIGWVGP